MTKSIIGYSNDLIITEVTEEEVKKNLKGFTQKQLVNWKGWINQELKRRWYK